MELDTIMRDLRKWADAYFADPCRLRSFATQLRAWHYALISQASRIDNSDAPINNLINQVALNEVSQLSPGLSASDLLRLNKLETGFTQLGDLQSSNHTQLIRNNALVVIKKHLSKRCDLMLDKAKSRTYLDNIIADLQDPNKLISIASVEKKLKHLLAAFADDVKLGIDLINKNFNKLPDIAPLAGCRNDWQHILHGKPQTKNSTTVDSFTAVLTRIQSYFTEGFIRVEDCEMVCHVFFDFWSQLKKQIQTKLDRDLVDQFTRLTQTHFKRLAQESGLACLPPKYTVAYLHTLVGNPSIPKKKNPLMFTRRTAFAHAKG